MSQASQDHDNPFALRQRALARLTAGIPPGAHGFGRHASPAEALAVLHDLALSPATAGDALALLHELQVHQVELDMQQEELRNTCIELESALLRQTARMERLPVGCMTIDAATVLHEINIAGAQLLGAVPDDVLGRPLASFLAPHGADRLHTLLARAAEGLAPQTCPLRLQPLAGPARELNATADRDATPGHFLVVLMTPAP